MPNKGWILYGVKAQELNIFPSIFVSQVILIATVRPLIYNRDEDRYLYICI